MKILPVKVLLTYLFCLVSVFTIQAQTYCNPAFPGGVTAITEVRLGTMTKTSAAFSSADFEDFTSLPVDTIHLSEPLLALVAGVTNPFYTDSVMLYLDLNDDGDFTDSMESHFIGTISNSNGALTDAAITNLNIYHLLTPGLTRLRVVKKQIGLPGPCNTTGVGQAEDYLVYFKPVYPCSGWPLAGTAAATPWVCPGDPVLLSVTGYTIGYGMHMMWEQSPAGQQLWTPIPAATTPVYVVPSVTQPTEFRMVFTCNNAGAPDISNTVTTNLQPVVTTNSPVCETDSLVVDIDFCSGCMINISGPNNFAASQSFVLPNAGISATGWYHYTASGLSCAPVTDSFFLEVVPCPDSVWPGDANDDLVVNNLDILYVALANNNSGPQRTGAGLQFIAQACPDWQQSFLNNVNFKHADCNGDGVISPDDTIAVTMNYGMIHQKLSGQQREKTTSLPDLYFDPAGAVYNGQMVSLPVKLGTQSLPMPDLMGLAAQIHITGAVLQQQPSVTASTGSWLTAPGAGLLYQKRFTNRVDVTLTRIDQQQDTISGTIAWLHLELQALASGDTIFLSFQNVVMMDNQGTELIGYNIIDTGFVPQPTDVQSTLPEHSFTIVPNPSKGAAVLITDWTGNVIVELMDFTGMQKKAFHASLSGQGSQVQLPADLPSGIYLIRIREASGKRRSLHLKWIRL